MANRPPLPILSHADTRSGGISIAGASAQAGASDQVSRSLLLDLARALARQAVAEAWARAGAATPETTP